ncbi:MAG: LysR family transcriptional regulator [Peptoniphilus harei]|uniref:LysR family transcriptional regulator n=1 Tax=Peptoniphilus harei TaxID=54005 RepID=UPI002587AAED|nr:LysR family transcriptional regulator [Peptoniphilus harei]MDU3087150.1 LysR family transcriptional regulator [Peptoniphilus harei]MDU6742896.1 LysR family transcriptional regulator [Peptoniphilus harei]
MDTINFKYVLEIFNEKNITRAAKNLFISQPALSQALKRIENTYNIKIFDEDYNLTRRGEIFVKYAKEIDRIVENLERELNVNEINIGISQFYGKYLLNGILKSISQLKPNLKTNVKEDISRYLEVDFARGDIELAFMPTPIVNNLKHKILFNEKLLLAMPEDFKLEKLKIENTKVLTMHKGSKLRKISDDILQEMEIKVGDIFEATNLDTINSLIISKRGVAILPDIVDRIPGVKYIDTGHNRDFAVVYKDNSKIDIEKFIDKYKEINTYQVKSEN